jgi:hypothetical protein
LGTPEDNDWFGDSLTAGDFNGDGYDDLAIGVPNEDYPNTVPDSGGVNVLYGTPSGLDSDGSQFWSQDSPGILGSAEAFDYFGYSLTAGDFNGDGHDDLAIGVPEESIGSIPDAGGVNVLYACTTIGAPVPDIKANGSDDPIDLPYGNALSITIEFEPGIYAGYQADWWCVADTPFGWYYYNGNTKTWQPGFHVSYQGPLEALSQLQVLNMSDLTTGIYTFYFGVDGVRNGKLDNPLYVDNVIVSITSP